MDDRTTGDSPHEVLLALAGRIDDDLLAWCRELVAVGEDGRALELITGTLVADGTPLPPRERAAVVAAARSARTDLDAEAVLPPAAEAGTPHRFDAGRGVEHLAAAVGALPERLVAGCRTWVTFRSTPAGSAPGPLPQPVVLVEVAADDQRPVDVLAYQLAIACARVGAPAAVEVVVAGAPRPEYQQAALRSALPVHGASSEDPAGSDVGEPEPVTPPTGTPEVGPGTAWPTLGSLVMPPEPAAARRSSDVPEAPAYDGPAYDRPDVDGPAHEGPAYDDPAHDSSAYDSSAYDSPAYDSPAHDSSAYDSPAHDSSAYDSRAYAIPAYEIPAYEIPAYEIPAYDPSAYAAPASDGPVPDAASSDAAPSEAPLSDSRAHDVPAHAEAAFGGPVYAERAHEEPVPEEAVPAEPAHEEPAHEAPAQPVAEAPAAPRDEPGHPAPSADATDDGDAVGTGSGEDRTDSRVDTVGRVDTVDRVDTAGRADTLGRVDGRSDDEDDLAPGDDLRPEDDRDAPARAEEPSWDFGSPADQRTDPGPRRPGVRPAAVTPLRSRTDGPRPRPSAVTPLPRPATPPTPLTRHRPLAPVADFPRDPVQHADADTPARASDHDPFGAGEDREPEESGFATRIDAADPLGLGTLPLRTTGDHAEEDGRPDRAERAENGTEAPVSDDWLADWISGDWAMSRSATDPLDPDQPVPGSPEDEARREEARHGESRREEPAREEPQQEERTAAGFAPPRPAPRSTPPQAPTQFPSQSQSPIPRSEPGSPVPPPPRPQPSARPAPLPSRSAAPSPEPGPEDDAVARLSEADRELLARLQAELGAPEAPRPRVSRRAGIGGDAGGPAQPAPNGRGPHPPPPDRAS